MQKAIAPDVVTIFKDCTQYSSKRVVSVAVLFCSKRINGIVLWCSQDIALSPILRADRKGDMALRGLEDTLTNELDRYNA